MSELLLATAVLDVTPPPGYPLDGYAARDGVSDGALDPLRATLLWLSTPSDPGVAWLCLDAVGVSVELARRLAEAVPRVPAARVLVCASHTHSGPSGWSGMLHPFLPAVQSGELEGALVSAVASAVLTPRPVEALWCAPDVPGVGANRHRADGPHDTSAGVLVLRGDSAEAILLDYACHPTVLGPENLSWSADWPGATRRDLPGVVGFLQGAAGDVSPRFVRRGRDATEVGRLGGILSARVSESLATARPIARASASEDAWPLVPVVRRGSVRLPVRALPPADQVEETLAAARAALEADPADRVAQSRVEGACGLATMSRAGLPGAFELPISVVTLGEIAWAHVPVELFTALAVRIKENSPYPVTRVVGYSDGYFGYVADEAGHASGAYEALMSYFDAATGEVLVAAVLDLLRKEPHDLR